MVHTCNPSTRRLRQEDLKFEACLNYKVRPSLKKEKEKIRINILNIKRAYKSVKCMLLLKVR
jgi:hypothetical protein